MRKPFHVSDINQQGNSGTVSLFLFVIKCFNFLCFCHDFLDKPSSQGSIIIVRTAVSRGKC